jgi:fatty acid desaturase
MNVEAWNYEHNHLHHYQLNEDTDPDLVEQNLTFVRESNIPVVFKYMFVTFFMVTWKWFYYASNTYANLKANEYKSGTFAPLTTLFNIFIGDVPVYLSKIEFILKVLTPYFIYQFILLPLPLYCLGLLCQFNVTGGDNAANYYLWAQWFFQAHKNATINLIVGDVITNIHAFICIVTNHAGHDMYRWKTHAKPLSAAFYIRAIVSSANYSAGNDYVDVLHGWLNYQAEHHCFPKLSMLSYQKAMPLVKDLCTKHKIPYVQENVFIRLKKTIDSMVGNTTMREIPLYWENKLNIIE